MTPDLNIPIDAIAWAKAHDLHVPDHLAPVLAAVAQYADPDGRNSHELYGVLAAAAGKSERQVVRDIAELLRWGLLEAGSEVPSWEALPLRNRPRNFDVPGLGRGRWVRPGGVLSAERCEEVWVKALLNSGDKIIFSGDMAPESTDRFTTAEAILNEINANRALTPSAYREARNLLCSALKNGHTPDWLRVLLAMPPSASAGPARQILTRLYEHQHQPPARPRLPVLEPAVQGQGNRTFIAAFETAHRIASAQQHPRTQYPGYEFQELLHMLLTAALNGATRSTLERIVNEEPPPGGHRVDRTLRSLWAAARGENRPAVARPAPEPEPEPEVWETRTPDCELDSVLAEQTDPIPPDTAATWADRIIRRINLHHTELDSHQVKEMRWRLSKALRNGQSPAYLARVLIQPAATPQDDPGAELLHRITQHYWPGRTP